MYKSSHCSLLDWDESAASDTSVVQEVNQHGALHNIHLLSVQHVPK